MPRSRQTSKYQTLNAISSARYRYQTENDFAKSLKETRLGVSVSKKIFGSPTSSPHLKNWGGGGVTGTEFHTRSIPPEELDDRLALTWVKLKPAHETSASNVDKNPHKSKWDLWHISKAKSKRLRISCNLNDQGRSQGWMRGTRITNIKYKAKMKSSL